MARRFMGRVLLLSVDLLLLSLVAVQGAIATKGEGLYEGLDWLSNTLKQMNRGTTPGATSGK